MSLSVKKTILSTLFALTMIVLTFHFAESIPNFPNPMLSILNFLPYLIMIVVIAISFTCKISRELNLAFSLILSYWLLQNFVWPTDANDATATMLYVLIAPALALNLIFITTMPEKGLYNKNGLTHLYIIVFELMILIWLVNFTPDLLLKYLYYPYFSSDIFGITPMYQSTVIISSVAFLYLLLNAIMKKRMLISSYLAVFISVIFALHFINTPNTAMMFFSVAGVIIIFTIGLNNYRFSKIDLITELPSLPSFKKQLNSLGERYCIALVEVDDFIEITNEYGQDISDQILRMVASRSQLLGRKGFPYRYGNKEFALIFYDMQLSEANNYLATLCDSIANEPFILRSKKRALIKPSPSIIQDDSHSSTITIPISVSVGIAEKQSHHQASAQVVVTAQEALDRAKEQQQYFATI